MRPLVCRAGRRGQDRSGREAPLTDPKHAASAGISRHGREGISYPCLERVRNLVGAGYIRGFHAVLEPHSVEAGMLVFVQVVLDRTTPDVFDAFKGAVQSRSAHLRRDGGSEGNEPAAAALGDDPVEDVQDHE
jgi:hypothetical protein